MAEKWSTPRCLVAAVLALAVLAAADVQARSYKWVDDEGRVHYSDSIPAEEAQKRRERELKSERGLTIERLEPPPTREALEARARAEARAEEQARSRGRTPGRDRVLLRTYRQPGGDGTGPGRALGRARRAHADWPGTG
ncbi:MAG: DUF4124 domain-containing protein [Arhodomonas sp.]|nr:DUF4124 domain-containing protein [Arhodomonas sp.]